MNPNIAMQSVAYNQSIAIDERAVVGQTLRWNVPDFRRPARASQYKDVVLPV